MANSVADDGDFGRSLIQEGRRTEMPDCWINNNYPKILVRFLNFEDIISFWRCQKNDYDISFQDYHPSSMTPIELQVTNLDQNIDQRDMKKTIMNIFREHVTVMSVSVFFQSGKFIFHQFYKVKFKKGLCNSL